VASFTRATGPSLSAFNAWIVLKGLDTLSVVAGWVMVDFVSPKLAVMENISTALISLNAAAFPPLTSNDTMPPNPDC
jgi:hypothetical protein